MTAPFDAAPRQRAKCRGCRKAIFLEPDGRTWADATGIPACIKGELKEPDHPGQFGGAIAVPPVFHQPMPAGLDGAPQPMESA